MEVHFIKRTDDVTPEMKQYMEEKITKIERVPIKIIDVRITMSIHGYLHFVDVAVLGKNHTFNAKAEDKDMFAAIDSVMDKIDHQLKKHKDITRDHKGMNSIKDEEIQISQEVEEEDM
ncbi:MAG: ribosome-associated translation inhibitor RaiA [Candidatus Ancaeobacter aquaticus]|nr:ribosome-associated translation inhibitor RaiA [Candidatus Ancaeobacter aquaticus]